MPTRIYNIYYKGIELQPQTVSDADRDARKKRGLSIWQNTTKTLDNR